MVFHEAGYKGGSEAFISNFSASRYPGAPLLQWMGMTTEKEFPAMTPWRATLRSWELAPNPALLTP